MAKFVGQSVDSILQQSFSDFELIVIADASEDGTDTVVRSYKDRQIIFERNSSNVGNYASRNRGMQLAQGKYIAVMDADDIAMPDRLEKQVAYLEEHSDVLAVGSGCISLPGGVFLHRVKYYDESIGDLAENDLLCRLLQVGSVVLFENVFVSKTGQPIKVNL